MYKTTYYLKSLIDPSLPIQLLSTETSETAPVAPVVGSHVLVSFETSDWFNVVGVGEIQSNGDITVTVLPDHP